MIQPNLALKKHKNKKHLLQASLYIFGCQQETDIESGDFS
jgi:hypothetical protein